MNLVVLQTVYIPFKKDRPQSACHACGQTKNQFAFPARGRLRMQKRGQKQHPVFSVARKAYFNTVHRKMKIQLGG